MEEYTCTLTEASLQKAKQELNEDPNNRLGAVQTFREWIEQQKHIDSITSTQYLIPFLRTAKFSQLRARQILEGYLELVTDLPHWYQDLDPLDPQQQEALKTGILMPLPGYDKEGRKVILYRESAMTKEMISRLKKDKPYKNNLFKAFAIIFKYLLFDENVQVNGYVVFQDFTDFTASHMTIWTMDEIRDIMKWQGNFPGRYKGFYYYNTGSVFDTLMEMVKPFIGKKMKERIKFLGSNLENVYKIIPKEMLPEEYLPDDHSGPCAGSMQQITANVLNELQKPEIRDRIVYETKPQWGVDRTQRDKDAATASFRKLNID